MTSENSSGLSRRTIAKGAAWAAPAVVVAAAAPKVSASPIVTVSQAGPACKLPGNSCSSAGYNKGYLQALRICNNSSQSVVVTITTPASLTFNDEVTEFTPIPSSFSLTTTGCQTVVLNLNLQDNSENSSISGTIHYSFAAADGQTGTGSVDVNTESTPPCSDCQAPVYV